MKSHRWPAAVTLDSAGHIQPPEDPGRRRLSPGGGLARTLPLLGGWSQDGHQEAQWAKEGWRGQREGLGLGPGSWWSQLLAWQRDPNPGPQVPTLPPCHQNHLHCHVLPARARSLRASPGSSPPEYLWVGTLPLEPGFPGGPWRGHGHGSRLLTSISCLASPPPQALCLPR